MSRAIRIFFVSFIFLISCDDNITFRSEFTEEPILYCIMDAESNEQFALVKKSFDDENSNSDNYVENVDISLTTQYQRINFANKIGDGIELPKKYYQTSEFLPAAGNLVKLEALLPNNKILTSEIVLPQFSLFFFEIPELFIPLEQFSNNYRLRWNIKNPSENVAFLIVMYLEYSILEGNEEKKYRIELPMEYVSQENELVPIYSSVTNNSFQELSQNTIDIALQNISEGDIDKSKYKIISGEIELFILEENLARYFASTETFRNTYSVKVYESIVSNINGGKGIFGAYVKRKLPIRFTKSYINSFGYNLELIEQ